MITRTSYVHVQTPRGKSLGFSAMFQPLSKSLFVGDVPTNSKGDILCHMSLTYCNLKDKHFCKKIAREELKKKAPQEVRVRDVPKILAAAESRCSKRVTSSVRYNYVLARFV